MRYMLDTNIVIYLTTDTESLSRDVRAILSDYDNTFCISAETTRELIVGYRKKSFAIKQWKSCEDLIDSLSDYYHLEILPIDKQVTKVHSRLEIKSDHKDPSDHTIISHAIATKTPLISSDEKFPYYVKQGLQLVYNKK